VQYKRVYSQKNQYNTYEFTQNTQYSKENKFSEIRRSKKVNRGTISTTVRKESTHTAQIECTRYNPAVIPIDQMSSHFSLHWKLLCF
jgi:hypothetical protein